MGCARFVGRSLAVPRWVSSLGLAGIGWRGMEMATNVMLCVGRHARNQF